MYSDPTGHETVPVTVYLPNGSSYTTVAVNGKTQTNNGSPLPVGAVVQTSSGASWQVQQPGQPGVSVTTTPIIVPTSSGNAVGTVGTVTNGKTYLLNGERVPEGTIVQTTGGNYQMQNGSGVLVDTVPVILPNGTITTGTVKDGKTYLPDGSRPPEGSIVKTAGSYYYMANGSGIALKSTSDVGNNSSNAKIQFFGCYSYSNPVLMSAADIGTLNPTQQLLDFLAKYSSLVAGAAGALVESMGTLGLVGIAVLDLYSKIDTLVSILDKPASQVISWANSKVGSIKGDDTSGYTVYQILNDGAGKVQYVGYTNNFPRRQKEHQKEIYPKTGIIRFPEEAYTMYPVATGFENRDDARVLEQALICAYTIVELKKMNGNMINSIATLNWNDSRFNDSKQRIIDLLSGLTENEQNI